MWNYCELTRQVRKLFHHVVVDARELCRCGKIVLHHPQVNVKQAFKIFRTSAVLGVKLYTDMQSIFETHATHTGAKC